VNPGSSVKWVPRFLLPPVNSNRIKISRLFVTVSGPREAEVATGYRLDDRGVAVRVSEGSIHFSSHRRPDRFWGPPSPCPVSNGGLLLTGVKRPVREGTTHLHLCCDSGEFGSISVTWINILPLSSGLKLHRQTRKGQPGSISVTWRNILPLSSGLKFHRQTRKGQPCLLTVRLQEWGGKFLRNVWTFPNSTAFWPRIPYFHGHPRLNSWHLVVSVTNTHV
jgi:hypothetical protein